MIPQPKTARALSQVEHDKLVAAMDLRESMQRFTGEVVSLEAALLLLGQTERRRTARRDRRAT